MNKKIDLHHHILPKEYLKALQSIGVKKSFGVSFPQWSIQRSLDLMEKQSVVHSFLSISAPGVYFGDVNFAAQLSRTLNEIIAETINKFPDKFSGFCILPLPDTDLALEELEYAMDVLKLDGVTLVSNVGNIYLGDNKWKRLYKELHRRKAKVLIHPNVPVGYELTGLKYPPGIYEVTHDTTRAVANLLFSGTFEKYPGISYILSHAGGAIPYLSFRISLPEHYLKGKILLKVVAPRGVEYYLKKLYYDTAMASSKHVFACLKEFVDVSKITFGTDCPYTNKKVIEIGLDEFDDSSHFSAGDRTMVYYNNALSLFPQLRTKVT